MVRKSGERGGEGTYLDPLLFLCALVAEIRAVTGSRASRAEMVMAILWRVRGLEAWIMRVGVRLLWVVMGVVLVVSKTACADRVDLVNGF